MHARPINLKLQGIPVRIVLPVVLTVILFVGTIFFLVLPIMEERLLTAKREMIRELTEAAGSILQSYHNKEGDGLLSRAQAQAQAVEHLQQMRYGPESKDYFWINDTHPILIMHPYRQDLVGQDISDFKDPNGKRLFVECVKVVQSQGAGYVDYQWQWKDDPQRIVPKISYVKGFKPWEWIIGTGIYVEDVREEIAAITRKLTWVCLGIAILIVGLSSYIIWQNLQSERRRSEAEKQSKLHQEQLFQADKMATLGTLVSGVAHEINNPVTFVMLNAPILQKVWDTALPILDDHQHRHGDFMVGQMPYSQLRNRIPLLMTNIAEGAERIKTIVADLKDYARQQPPEMDDSIDINAVSAKAVGLVGNLIKKSTHNFQADYGTNIPAISGNTQKIEQVIINLLVNACEALTEVDKAVHLSTAYDARRQQVVIEVSDQGRGIPADALQHIRDPFFTTKRDDGGTGLGLAIAERIVQDHRGEMIFTSQRDRGTTVQLRLPSASEADTVIGGAYE